MSGSGARNKRRQKRMHLQAESHTFENGFAIDDRADVTKVQRLLYCIDTGDQVSVDRFARSKRAFELARSARLIETDGSLTLEAKEFIQSLKEKK